MIFDRVAEEGRAVGVCCEGYGPSDLLPLLCTLPLGHDGPHVAEGENDRLYEIWGDA